MHTVAQLREALRAARRLGYEVRHEWLGGAGGGACELRGRKILVVDLAMGPADQLQVVVEALRADRGAGDGPSPETPATAAARGDSPDYPAIARGRGPSTEKPAARCAGARAAEST